MRLEIGTVLGPYQIVSGLGAGGMGEVYRARDTRLGRDVALKVLRSGKFVDVELRRRFVHEANAAGALNHPNIVSVFDVNLDGDNPYIVTELVEGESLRKPLDHGPIAVRKLLDIATQVADGMAAAHQASIVHRDLKPENILLTRTGRAKIADFGLAKSLSRMPENLLENGEHDYQTVSMSALGVVVGTVEYMSPEQASGNQVDTRSDIFSFGLILYEMVSGKRAFERRSKVETLEAIINAEPPPLPVELPLPIKWCIERCLAKDPKDRYNSTLDLYHDLRGIRERLPDATGFFTGPIPQLRAKRNRSRAIQAGLLAAVLSAGAATTAFLLAPAGPDLSAIRYHPLATGSEWEDWAAWSPQGGVVAYHAVVDGHAQVFTRSLESSAPVQLTHCAVNCDRPAWSADGRQIFLRSNNGVWVVGAAGGEPKPLVPDVEAFAISPVGNSLAFIRRNSDQTGISVWTSSPPGENLTHYLPAPYEGVGAGTGLRLLFAQDGRSILLWGRFFGRGSEFWMLPNPAASGKVQRVLESLQDAFPVRGFSWLKGGRRLVLAAALPPSVYRTKLYLADLDGGRVTPLAAGIGSQSGPSASPDGKQIAYTETDYDTNVVEIPLDGSPVRNLVATGRLEHSAVWSPRGKEFAYVTDRSGVDEIWIRNVETGREQPVVTPRSFPRGENEFLTAPVFSPDGERIAFVRHNRSNPKNRDATEIWIAPATGGAPVPLADVKGAQWAPTWSPDGNWIAYTSQGPPFGVMKARVGGNEPGQMLWTLDLSVLRSVPEWSPKGDWIAIASKAGTLLLSPDGKQQRVLRAGGFAAMTWSHDGTILYGLEGIEPPQRIVAVDLASGKEHEVARVPPGMQLGAVWIPGAKLSLSADGRSLAATAVRQTGDIWLMENFDTPSLWRRMFR